MNSSDFIKIHDIALAETLTPSLEYHYRSICRWYSEKYHTPLHIVERDLSPQYVLSHYYESQISHMEEEDVETLIAKALDPDWDEDEEEDIKDFINMIEQEDKARLKRSGNKKQSVSEPSGTSDVPPVTRTYDELPPPEAGSDPDDV
jgi:primosomal protein N'